MQQIFIKKLHEIAAEFSKTLNNGNEWRVQFVVTTHSTHIANEAKFEAIRYFLTSKNEQRETSIKDLRTEFNQADLREDKEFLHKYLTLTKCDLYFADKAILIEGTAERIMLPLFISKVDTIDSTAPQLSIQYITVIEVGGAYAHHFYKFLDFLELRTLVITDLDSVQKSQANSYTASLVKDGTHTSNSGIKNWFAKGTTGYYLLTHCLTKTAEQKVSGSRRIAYQIAENGNASVGRSFEEALILANRTLFGITETDESEIESIAKSLSPGNDKKSEFALRYALEETTWTAPKYIIEGLQWLAAKPNIPAEDVIAEIQEVIEITSDAIEASPEAIKKSKSKK